MRCYANGIAGETLFRCSDGVSGGNVGMLRFGNHGGMGERRGTLEDWNDGRLEGRLRLETLGHVDAESTCPCRNVMTLIEKYCDSWDTKNSWIVKT